MSKERKERIQQRINAFATGRFADNAFALFKELGYESDKRIALDKGTFEGLFAERPTANMQKALIGDWLSADYLFQLTEEEITRQKSLFSVNQYNPNEFQSYSFVAIELKNEHYARGKLSQITREVNKLFPMPVMILFKHGNTLTLSVINRRLHKRDDSKDVLEKVTLIKDIRISPAGGGVHRTGVEVPLKKGGQGVVTGGEGAVTHRAHIEILFDLSFDALKNKHGFTNFVELHDAWQKTLDTSELNKRFFKELANWYFWAMDNVEFPDDLEKQKDVRNATNLIRLITRLVFIWFIKEKELLPDLLFNKNHLNTILNDFNKDNTSNVYYHAILQNLFFGTLNQKMGERDFAKEGSHYDRMEDYGVKNLFRYPDKFAIKEKEVIELFKDIPFLNGGLFDCLDKPDEKNVIQYVDGFSRKKSKQAKVPDFLFFSDELEVDLNEIFGTKNKKYTAKGLIILLDSYKFTVAENTPIEEEIALDPELLGKVFENLLASYNPETQTTARKQTGSFYTPREIVNYMVDESLIAYLAQALCNSLCHAERSEASQDSSPAAQNDSDCRLRDLLRYSENPNPFDEKETQVLIEAIDNCKILDPACGSGAFPMGILHKLVHILHKLDQRNELWKQRQIDKALQIDDPNIRDHATQDIEEAFENNELDYGRKLYLIENCIYGVDIQPIAVQIAKLRFFISLIIDEKKQPGKENLGIRSLPNLETKFVAANTLIALDKPQGQLSFRNLEIERLEKELKELRHEYFNAKTRKEKLQCQKQDKKLRQDIAGLLVNDGWNNTTARQIAAFDLYDQNASAEFFDSEWMFGLKEGFDVVIGNPPYGLLNKRQNQVEAITITPQQLAYYKNLPDYTPARGGMINIFKLFILKSIYLLKNNGIFSEIFPLAFIADSSAANLRNYIFNNCCIQFIEAFPERDDPKKRVFEAAKMSVCVMNLVKNNKKRSFFIRINRDRYIDEQKSKNFLTAELIALLDKTNLTIPLMSQGDIDLIANIYRKSIRFGDIGHCYTGEIDITLGKPYISYSSQDAPLLRGAIIGRYIVRNTMSQGEFLYLKKHKYLKENFGKKSTHFQSERIVMQGITGINEKIRLKMTLIDKEVFCANSTNYIVFHDNQINAKFALSILNSRLMNYIFSKFSTNSNVNGYEIDNLPYPKIKESHIQQPFITLVDKILTLKQKDPQADTLTLERQIDVMVYKLYGLTYEEVKIIDPEFTMNAVEYEAVEVK